MLERFGDVHVLMNNAGIQPGSGMFGPEGSWERGFRRRPLGRDPRQRRSSRPACWQRGKPGLIVNTGSKQGITTPPGDPAYNVAKAGVKAFTEALEHELRNRQGRPVTAHLLIPGFVYTPLTARAGPRSPRAPGRRSRRSTS